MVLTTTKGSALQRWECISKNGNREGLSLCGVKVSGYTMPSQAHLCYAPKNPTTLVAGVVRCVCGPMVRLPVGATGGR